MRLTTVHLLRQAVVLRMRCMHCLAPWPAGALCLKRSCSSGGIEASCFLFAQYVCQLLSCITREYCLRACEIFCFSLWHAHVCNTVLYAWQLQSALGGLPGSGQPAHCSTTVALAQCEHLHGGGTWQTQTVRQTV